MALGSTASVDPNASGKFCCSKVSHLRTSTDRSSSPLPLMTAGLIGYGLLLQHWKWNWSEMTAPLDHLRHCFLKVPYGNCQSQGCLSGTLHILFHWPCLLLWMRCNVVAKCISTPLPSRSCEITRANKLSYGYWVYSLTLFCVCWLMARNLLRGFGLVWNWGQECLRMIFINIRKFRLKTMWARGEGNFRDDLGKLMLKLWTL